ncbi:MAG: MFS transporter [Pseudomonadota bacterium]
MTVFYGWVVASGGLVILTVAYGLQFSYGVFVESFESALGLTRAEVSLPYSVYVVVYGTLSFVAGSLTDRFGPRLVISVGGIALGLGFAWLSTAQSVLTLYLGFTVVAGIGMSVAFVPCTATVVRWFERHRGLALGLTSSGISAAALVFPLVAATLLSWLGWRSALAVLGVGGLIGIVAAAQLMVRDPSVKGLLPDGDEPTETDVAPARESFTWRNALATQSLWVLVIVLSLSWITVFVPFVHVAALALEFGFSAWVGAGAVSAIGLGGLLGRLLAGVLADQVGRLPTLAAGIAFQALAFLLFMVSVEPWLLWFAAALFGLSYSTGSVVFPAIVGDYFGPTHAGAIAGTVFAIGAIAAGVGPWLAGWSFDRTDAYWGICWLGYAVNLVALLVLLALKKPPTPKPRPSPQPDSTKSWV